MVCAFFLTLLFTFNTAQAKEPGADYDRQNERIGLDSSPTAARIRDVEMVLGAVYDRNEMVSLSEGAEELANRKGTNVEQPRRSDRSGSSNR